MFNKEEKYCKYLSSEAVFYLFKREGLFFLKNKIDPDLDVFLLNECLYISLSEI